MPPVLEINMNPRHLDCHLCGQPTEHKWGVPIFNGDVVSNDFPDDLWSEGGGGQAVCERCYELHAAGQVKTYDRYYMHLFGFVDGGGI
jgi:hypothetical protein